MYDTYSTIPVEINAIFVQRSPSATKMIYSQQTDEDMYLYVAFS
jgi:hypothetical protein